MEVPTEADPVGYSYGLANSHLFETNDMIGFPFPWLVPYTEPVPLATGVTLVNSGTVNQMIVEHPGGIIMVEASGSQYQSQSYLDLAAEVTGSPVTITHLLQTHYHFDHASGVREILGATGATLVVGDGVEDFWTDVLMESSTIVPDSVSEGNMTDFEIVSLDTLERRVLLETDSMVVTAYHTTTSPHAIDMTLFTIDVDGQRILYEADLYNAGFGGTVVLDGPTHLFEALREHNLIDDDCNSADGVPLWIVPTHGFPLTLEQSIAELASLGTDIGCL